MVTAQRVAGPQNEPVKSKKRSGILTAYSLLLIYLRAGMVNAYRSARISFRRKKSSNAVMMAWTAVTVERVSRVACAVSMMPESSYASAIFERITAVRRSIASATTAGDGGRGTFDAKDRFESAEARPGVRVKADRARVVAGSTSESSLKKSQYIASTTE